MSTSVKLIVASVLALSAAQLAACNGEDCGPGEAPASGINIASSALMSASGITYGDAFSSPNNDCSVDGAPTSLTVEFLQLEPQTANSRSLILCVPRPDRLGDVLDLTDDSVTTGVQVIDIFGDDGDCLVGLDRTNAISGTATFTGACGDGNDPAGYALSLSGQIPATLTCPGGNSSTTLTLSGEVAVEAIQL